MQERAIELIETRDAEKAHARHHLLLQQFEHAHHTRLTACSHAIAVEPADTHRIGAERDRLQHVRPATEAAVYHHLRALRYRIHHLRQHVERAAAMVELATAVIGDIDDLH